jgi:hypothetical protein
MTSTSPDVAACAAEIVALHRLFETWLGAPGEGDFARFEAAFAPGFAMVMPSGARLDRAAVLAFLRQARGSRGEDFRIAVEAIDVLHAAPPLLLLHYIERQWLHGQPTGRRASAMFRMEATGPSWLFVQETWITPPQ